MRTLIEIASPPISEDSPFFVMMRVHGLAGATINQASMSSIVATMYERTDPAPTQIQTAVLTIGIVIFDTLQLTGWTVDTIGYNFGHVVPATWVPKGGTRYDLEYRVTPTTGEPYYLPRVRIRTLEYASS